MNSLELLLTKQIYGPDSHPHRWDKFVYDDEHLHYAILQILFESSQTFRSSLFGLKNSSSKPEFGYNNYKPKSGLFDMRFDLNGSRCYCEIKIWASLSSSQLDKQTELLQQEKAKGIYILLAKAGSVWSSAQIAEQSRGYSRVVTLNELRNILSKVAQEADLQTEMLEIARAYDKALASLNQRWQSPESS
jgi:hypothetical protein